MSTNDSSQPGLQASSLTPVPPVPQDPIVGIDLGTTNSLVAFCDHLGPRVLADEQGRNLLPSVVRIDPATGRAISLGFEARSHAVEFPQQTIHSVKRLMGRGMKDVTDELHYLPYQVTPGSQDSALVRVGSHDLWPQQISAMILSRLREQASRALGCPVTRAVVTVPAYFDDAQRQATRDAGRLAGLNVLRIVNEPTAAALAYNLGQRHEDATVAVFDLGGGTFDVSILRLQQTESGTVDQVLATSGDTHLGGDDVDRLIVELLQREIQTQFGSHIAFPPSTRQAMRTLAEAAKIRLSEREETTIELDLGNGRTLRRTITRDELDAMMLPWVERAIACCKTALKAAKLTTGDIQRVVMVGGSTRIPLVRKRVEEVFGTPLYTALNPDEVVALGASAQAAILAGVQRDMLLLDVISLSLGIETMGGAMAKLITANTTIPCRATEMFTTYADGQPNVKIHVLQGERELAQDCRSLGQFELRGIPPMPAGLPKVEVTFLVDASGILSVSAIEKRSDKSASIQVVPTHGLSREDVARIEAQSVTHAKADMIAHRLIDLRNQARLDIRAIERQLARVGDKLDAEYRAQIERGMAEVRAFVDLPQPDPNAFHKALDAMDKSTVRLAEIAIKATLTDEGLLGPR